MTALPHILLVTGSRALADFAAAERWAADAIAEAMHVSGADIVVAGDARPVDTEAIDRAARLGLRWTRFDLAGMITRSNGSCRPWASVGERESTSRKVWPLRRNEAMVDAVREAVASRRYTASAVAFRAPWACTNGTAHTAQLCRDRGIAVVEHVCPVMRPA